MQTALLEPKEFIVTDVSGRARKYYLSKFPAIAGREIIAQYPLTALPKVGNYGANEAIMFKLMAYVGVELGDAIVPLSTPGLINNHVPEFETLAKIEIAMMDYNCSFFRDGRASTFLAELAQIFSKKVIETLTSLSGQLSPNDKPPSTNSEPSTP